MIHARAMTSQSLLATLPHSGEKIPDFCTWLQGLPEEILMCDVDRYIDFLYEPALNELKIPFVKTEWHRYAGDLNRLPEDVDSSTIENHATPRGPHVRGFHWAITTHAHILMPQPMSMETHEKLVKLIYEPFHQKIKETCLQFPDGPIYHLDLHSMPSVGTAQHRDPGELRADIVISDQLGKSSSAAFRDLVISSFVVAGFKVGYNWPYLGGRMTETYGRPSMGHHTLQVELNRSLYMDEKSKKLKNNYLEIQNKLKLALSSVVKGLS
jgi:N-formylglutamate deformylase